MSRIESFLPSEFEPIPEQEHAVFQGLFAEKDPQQLVRDDKLALRASIAAWVSCSTNTMPNVTPADMPHISAALTAVSAQYLHADDDRLREEVEDRFLSIQLKLNPMLADAVNNYKSDDFNLDPSWRLLYSLIGEGMAGAEAWIDKAACAKLDPNQFHFDSITDARRRAPSALLVCAGCEVREECLDLGKKIANKHAGIRIFGGKVFGISKSENTEPF